MHGAKVFVVGPSFRFSLILPPFQEIEALSSDEIEFMGVITRCMGLSIDGAGVRCRLAGGCVGLYGPRFSVSLRLRVSIVQS